MTRHRWLAPLAVVSLVVAACGGQSASTAPSASDGGTEPSAAAPSASASGDQSMTYVIDSDLSGGLSNAADNVPTAEAAQFLYDGIYEFDEGLTPVADLATDLATISEDGLTWTVTLKPGVKFHDGTDLTADDVVQTYELAKSPNCTYSPADLPRSLPRQGREGRRHDRGVHPQAAALDVRDASTCRSSASRARTRSTPPTPAISRAATRSPRPRPRHILDAVAAEEAAPTGAAGEDGAPTVDYPKFAADGEAILEQGRSGPAGQGAVHGRRRGR